MTKIARLSVAIALCAVLPGCVSVRSVSDVQAAERASESAPSLPDEWTSARERVGNVQVGWIAAFGDPVLEALVEEALANNRNLQAAEANVRRSWALARQAGAQQYPFLDVSAGAARQDPIEGPGRSTTYSAAAAISYEVDIWNRIAAGEAAAVAGAEAAEADFLFTQYSIAAAVARSYFLAIEAREQVQVAQNVFDALTEITRIVNLRYRYGFASAFDVSLSEADLAAAADSLATARNGQIDALRALEALLGRYPAGLLETAASLPEQPLPPGEGLPSELLERRPDLVAAERSIAASLNASAQARAARLPSFSLSSTVGGASSELENVLDPANVAWTLAGNILAPIFRGGALSAAVDVADADVEAAVALYGDTAITAFNEVESALDRGVFLRDRHDALVASTEQSRNALRLSNLQYQEGEIDLIDVLSIQQRVFGAESSLIAIRRAQLDQFLELSLALGGDWRTTPESSDE
uniref:efflux transporter outer membrane subunit n=1 Tax=uncultured Altererythrobacter sp. TaxID=500840 RepID=UPI00261EC514|nr:efflux transporter outer membrane subunit [uncultured Altererythrobacter sp.]